MKEIFKIFLVFGLVISALFGANEEQKSQIVAKITEHFKDNLTIPSRCPKDLNNEHCPSFEKDFPDGLKKYFTDDFLNTFKNNQNEIICSDVCRAYFPKEVEKYIFVCKKNICKIDDVINFESYNAKEAVLKFNNAQKETSKTMSEFFKKLSSYTQKYKVSKEFYSSFQKANEPLGTYYADSLKKCEDFADIKVGGDYSLEFDNGLIILRDWREDGDNLHLIFDCKNEKCQIIDIGTYTNAWYGAPKTSWLKESCKK